MEALVLNTEFQAVGVVDVFESFIWTDRYSAWGDFEVYTHPTPELIDMMQYDYYLWNEQSEHTMIIEASKIETDIENGDHITFTGRSLEAILDRRVVWEFTELGHFPDDEEITPLEEVNLQNGIKTLLERNCLPGPDCPLERQIPNLVFEESDDPRVTSLTTQVQIPAGSNLYEVIKTLCDEKGLGFKIILDDDNNFVFSLYMGQDRSYSQETNPYVVFSPEYDNLLNSNYQESYVDFRNAALVIGDDDGDDQRQATVTSDNASGLDRREVFVDGSSMSWEDEEGNYFEPEEYDEQLAQLGREVLSEAGMVQSFEGEAEYRRTYEYQKDFFIGDIVQLENEYGIQATSRITEMVFSHDGSGENAIPTFVSLADSTLTTAYSSGSTGRTTTGQQIESFLDDYSEKHAVIVAGAVNGSTSIASKSVPNNTLTELGSFELSEGLWIVKVHLRWNSNGTGYRMFNISTTSLDDDGLSVWNNVQVAASPAGNTHMYLVTFLQPTVTTRYYVNASQTSGGSLGCLTRWGATRIMTSGNDGSDSGGGTGTNNYNDLTNKPQIENNVLIGNQTFEDLGLEALSNQEIEEMLT